MFDTLKFARALRDGGWFTPEQAERLSDALSEAMAGEVAGRGDLEAAEARLGRRIDDLRAELKQDIADLRAEIVALETRLDRKIEALRSELKGDIRGLEAKIEAAKVDTIKWVVSIIGFQSVAIIGAAIVLARVLAH